MRAALGDRAGALVGHALHETYAVLTRLPGDAHVAPADAVRLLRERFETRDRRAGSTYRLLDVKVEMLG